TALLDVKNIARTSLLRLSCADGIEPGSSLHIGEQTATSSLQQLSQDQLFLSLDTSALPAGCVLQATIDNGREGKSQPFTLAHMIRVPQIDSFASAGAGPASGVLNAYTLTGQNLEMIEKAGWDQANGVDVTNLPTPIPGAGQKQSLQISLPAAPNGQAVLWVWLRGDKQGRVTTIKAPATAVPPAPSSPPL
ncbi:MAG: hypothetical protein WB992_18940, partial [Bryobacteraceae bacterium]